MPRQTTKLHSWMVWNYLKKKLIYFWGFWWYTWFLLTFFNELFGVAIDTIHLSIWSSPSSQSLVINSLKPCVKLVETFLFKAVSYRYLTRDLPNCSRRCWSNENSPIQSGVDAGLSWNIYIFPNLLGRWRDVLFESIIWVP